MKFKNNKGMKQYREFKKCFSLIKKINARTTTEEVDLTTGYALGVIDEKASHFLITRGQKQTLLELIEAVRRDRKNMLERKEEAFTFTDPEGTASMLEDSGIV